jgi:peroxiredoxin family protein
MNVLLPEKFNKKVVDMIDFDYNEYEILHRNMPFMFKKLNKDEIKVLEKKKKKQNAKIKVTHSNKKH